MGRVYFEKEVLSSTSKIFRWGSRVVSTFFFPYAWNSILLGLCQYHFRSFCGIRFSSSFFLNPWSHCCCSVTQLCQSLCDPRGCSTPGSPAHHQYPELAQSHVHRVGGAIQPSHPLLSPSPLAFNLSQHQGLLQWVGSSHQEAKVLEPLGWVNKCLCKKHVTDEHVQLSWQPKAAAVCKRQHRSGPGHRAS